MASTIVTKNSSTASAVPVTGDLTQGELAVNVTDKKLYTKDSGGTVVKLVGGLGNQEANAVAITGGSINGTTVGATTASTGAFTTLSASSTTTLSGGTANGVAYLNGSKVVTTGSALTFDGTNLGVALNNNTPKNISVAYSTVPGYFSNSYDGSVGLTTLSNNTWNNSNGSSSWASFANTGYSSSALQFSASTGASDIRFLIAGAANTNPTEQMRLTSTGLGIGTSSPNALLHIKGSSNPAIYWENSTYGAAKNAAFMGSSGQLVFGRAGSSDWLTIDSSGNLGLGVTPSAWASGYKAFDVSSAGAFTGTSSGAQIWSNAVDTATGSKYKNTAAAGTYQISGATHAWYTAASGTAGNAITFTQAMTLDASGNLVVGATSANSKLDVYGVIRSSRTENSGYYSEFKTNYSDVNTLQITVQGSTVLQAGATNDLNIYALGANNLKLYTNSSERARIDSSGNLLVGVTSAGARFQVQSSGSTSSTYCTSFLNNGGFPLFDCRDDGRISTGSRGVSPYNNTTASAANMYVDSSGILYRSTSSLKYKTNVKDTTRGLSDLLKLRAVTYEGKSESDEGKTFGGLIAEEVHEAGLTEFVQYAEDGTPDALAYGNMVSLLVKAIQEQQAIIEQLKADVAALKGN